MTLLQLHLTAIYAILLSSVLGFGIAMGINYAYIQFVTWRLQVSHDDNPVWISSQGKQLHGFFFSVSTDMMMTCHNVFMNLVFVNQYHYHVVYFCQINIMKCICKREREAESFYIFLWNSKFISLKNFLSKKWRSNKKVLLPCYNAIATWDRSKKQQKLSELFSENEFKIIPCF